MTENSKPSVLLGPKKFRIMIYRNLIKMRKVVKKDRQTGSQSLSVVHSDFIVKVNLNLIIIIKVY